jgi:DNA-binding response OmpR family regulator
MEEKRYLVIKLTNGTRIAPAVGKIVYADGRRAGLTKCEARVLELLAAADGVFICAEAFETRSDGVLAPKTHILKVRCKLGAEFVESKNRFGYRLVGFVIEWVSDLRHF